MTAVLQRADTAISTTVSANHLWLPSVMRWAVYVVAATAATCYLVVVIMNLHTRLGLNHVDGAWLNQAQDARRGLLPPPLSSEGYYSGTRYQPLAIAMLAVIGGVLGDDTTAGRLLNLLSFAAALAVAAFWMWCSRVPAPLIYALLLLAGATSAGSLSMISVRSDALPAAFQLAAVGIIALQNGRPKHSALMLSGALVGAAPAFKLTALWALVALLLWLAYRRELREAAVMLRAAIVSFACLFLPFVISSRGGALTQLAAATVSGEDSLWRLDKAFVNLAYYSSKGDVVTLPLLAAASAAVLLVVYQRRITVLHVALVLAFAQVFMISADRGVGPNQLIDVVLLSLVAVGIEIAGALRTLADPAAGQLVALAVVLVLAVGGTLMQWNKGPVVAALRGTIAPQVVRDPLAGRVPPGTPLLSEDPGLPAARGERAVVGDAFMFRRLAAQRSGWSEDLARRVEAHEFGAVVLLKHSRPGAFWYANFHFGTTVHTAIVRNYRLDRTLPNGMLLYVPIR